MKTGLLPVLAAVYLSPALASAQTFTVTPNGLSALVVNGTNNPTLTLARGTTYTFNINASGHPFYIKTVANSTGTGNQFTSGVTGNGTTVGTLTFSVPLDAPDTLFYHCAIHFSMGGTLNIVDAPGSPPSVTITNPVNGTVVVAPANLLIEASASDPDGNVTNVQFRVGGATINNDTTSPYSATTNNLPAGTYTLSAIASDNNGTRATNFVDVICNARPLVAITNVATGAKFAAPANITLEADATDMDGVVTNVQFFSGSGLLGSAKNSPFAVMLNGAGAGNYSFTAVAADNYGTLQTSAVVNAFVLTNPTLTAIRPLAGGQLQLTISGIEGQTYATESSSNFENWSAFTTNMAPSDIFNVTDFTSPEVLRFYRARQDF